MVVAVLLLSWRNAASLRKFPVHTIPFLTFLNTFAFEQENCSFEFHTSSLQGNRPVQFSLIGLLGVGYVEAQQMLKIIPFKKARSSGTPLGRRTLSLVNPSRLKLELDFDGLIRVCLRQFRYGWHPDLSPFK